MKITGFEDVTSIDEFCCVLTTGEHPLCTFTVTATSEKSRSLLEMLGKECTAEGEDFNFCGTITDVALEKHFECDTVRATVLGSTIKSDEEKKYRVYQGSEMRLSDMLKSSGMSDVFFLASPDNCDINNVIVQDGETDWAFLKRIASHFGMYIFPSNKLGGNERPRVGAPRDGDQSIEEDDIISIDLVLKNDGRSECTCRLVRGKMLNFGQNVKVLGREMFVDGVTYKNVREEYLYEYHLSETAKEPNSQRLPNCTLTAAVTDNEDPDKKGRVRVRYLEPYEDVLEDKGIWTPHAQLWASKGLGVASVPWIGDVVRVKIRDGKSEVISSIRTEPFDSRFEEPDTRYILFGEDTHVAINDEKIAVRGKQYSCEITSDSAVVKFGDKVSVGIEDGRVVVDSGSSQMGVDKDVNLKTGEFKTSADGRISLSAGGNVSIKGGGGVSIA